MEEEIVDIIADANQINDMVIQIEDTTNSEVTSEDLQKKSSENVNKIMDVKARLSTEIDNVDRNIAELDKSRQVSIERIELEKSELRKLSEAGIHKEKERTEQELKHTSKEIENRKLSITLLDETIAKLDKQITEIQHEHDISVKELEQKKCKLNQYLKYYDELSIKLDELLKLCQEKSEEHESKLKSLLEEREALLKRTDLSETTLAKLLSEKDQQIDNINKEHELVLDAINIKISSTDLQEINEEIYKNKMGSLIEEREALLNRTDISETTLAKLLQEQDEQIAVLNEEHELVTEAIAAKLSASDMQELNEIYKFLEEQVDQDEVLLTAEQIAELQAFELRLQRQLQQGMTNEERLLLLRRGFQITPSGRIITMNDRTITLEEARRLGLLSRKSIRKEDESEEEESMKPSTEKLDLKGLFYGGSTPSEISSSSKSTSESSISSQDIDYLKRVFGKSLTKALGEIVALQPADPIHYLAHWFIKYRNNQEIDEVTRIELQDLMIERERLEAERWHAELEEEARLAVLEALFRAENIIMQQDFERMELLGEMEGDYEYEKFDPLELLF